MEVLTKTGYLSSDYVSTAEVWLPRMWLWEYK